MYDDQDKRTAFLVKLGFKIIGGLVLLALIIALAPYTVVEAGQRAVVTRLGAVDRTLDSGIHWKTPFVEDVVIYDTRVQKEEATASAASFDLQTVTAVVAVNYSIDPTSIADTYARIGTQEVIKTKVIDPAVQEVVKAATAKYKADELLTKRAEVTDTIQVALVQRLQPYNLIITNVSIVNFDFSSGFNQAIEAKVTAQQQALKAENDLARIQFEAQQTIETAKAQAESIRIQAQAINSQGGADYVELQKINKWNGMACTSYCGLEASTGLLVNGR